MATPNIDRILEWVLDLESGEHAQGRDYLHYVGTDGEPDRFCCLGRACVLSGVAGAEDRTPYGDKIMSYGNDTSNRTYGTEVIYGWLGLTHADIAPYAAMNDDGATFREIAARIRADFGLPAQPSSAS